MKRDKVPSWQKKLELEFVELVDQRSLVWNQLFATERQAHEARMRLIGNREDDELKADVAALEQTCVELKEQQNDASDKVDAHLTEWQRQLQLYRRPTGWWLSFLNRWLGPLPDGVERIDFDRAEFDAAPSRWPQAIATAVLALASIVGLISLLPASGASPANVALGNDLSTPIILGALTGLLLVGLYRRLRGRFLIKDFAYSAALNEELQFRLGAEAWTWRQRAASCITFGIAHLTNLIYAVATLGVLMLVGAAYLAVYLIEFKHTGDRRRAIIAASKFHANYNLIALTVSVLILLLYWFAVIATLFTTGS